MRRIDEVALFLADYPLASNDDIAEQFGITNNYAKKLVFDLRKAGIAEVDSMDGMRTITIDQSKIGSAMVTKSDIKQERIERVLDIVMEALEREPNVEHIVGAGNLIVKLLDRL